MDGVVMAVFGAAIAVFLGAFGSSIGIGYAGQAANGVLSEDPDKFGTMLLLVALPGTQGIYGFLAAFLVILKIGFIGTPVAITTAQGLAILASCLPVGIACLISGIHQGRVCAAGIAVAAKKPGDATKAVTFAAMVETYAVLGLLITIFLLNGITLS